MRLSGAKLVLVEIDKVGKCFFPYVEQFIENPIQYIDFHPTACLPETSRVGVASDDGLTISLANKFGNVLLFNNLPLKRLNYTATCGTRQAINAKLSFQNSFIINEKAENVGKSIALLVWYEAEQYRVPQFAEELIFDTISVKLEATKTKIKENERMNFKRFRHIFATPVTKTQEEYVGVTEADLANLYLTAIKGSYSLLENVPLSILHQNKILEKIEFENIQFDISNTFITTGHGANLENRKGVCLTFCYEK